MNENWKYRFFELAFRVADWSKEEKKVGAVLVDLNRRIAGTGYNGAPPGVDDSLVNGNNSDYLVCHAEPNALANSKGKKLTLFATQFPCLQCAMAILGSRRVIAVVAPNPRAVGRWAQSQQEALKLLQSSKIKVSLINGRV